MNNLLETKDIVIKDLDGNDRTYIISKFPAVAGREITDKYPVTDVPKLSSYEESEKVMLKAMRYVGVKVNDSVLVLVNIDLVNNHVPDWKTLRTLEEELLKYNYFFFKPGQTSAFLADLAQNIPQWISKMLTGLLAGLSEQEKPRSTS